MRDLILDTTSTILCPHGGTVVHVPTAYCDYKVNGRPPMRQHDSYFVAGCPFMGAGGAPSPCIRVDWVTASVNLIVKGSPVLLRSSTGLCIGPSAMVQGPPIIAYSQLSVREPDEFTNVG